MPCTADFWVRRPPACEHMKRDVELGLGIPAHSGQQSPSSSAGQPWSPRNPLPWPCQWPSWCVYSMGTWPFAQSALTTPGKMALQSGHLRDPPKHRPGITEGEGGRFLFHFFSLVVPELRCYARAFSVAVSSGLIVVRGLLGVVVSPVAGHRL